MARSCQGPSLQYRLSLSSPTHYPTLVTFPTISTSSTTTIWDDYHLASSERAALDSDGISTALASIGEVVRSKSCVAGHLPYSFGRVRSACHR